MICLFCTFTAMLQGVKTDVERALALFPNATLLGSVSTRISPKLTALTSLSQHAVNRDLAIFAIIFELRQLFPALLPFTVHTAKLCRAVLWCATSQFGSCLYVLPIVTHQDYDYRCVRAWPPILSHLLTIRCLLLPDAAPFCSW